MDLNLLSDLTGVFPSALKLSVWSLSLRHHCDFSRAPLLGSCQFSSSVRLQGFQPEFKLTRRSLSLSLTATASHSNTHPPLETSHSNHTPLLFPTQHSLSRCRFSALLKGTLRDMKGEMVSLTCHTNHRPLRRVQHRVLALPLPPLVFGQVPWQRVSGRPRGSWWARGQRPPWTLATEGRLADAGALA